MRNGSKAISSSALVGRAHELEYLDQMLASAKQDTGHCLLIGGEAGIGKSRLLTEARMRATGEGLHVLEGQCFEQDVSFPFAPLIDVLRAYLVGRTTEEVRETLGANAPELVKLLPELVTKLAALVPTPMLEPEAEKRRLFESILEWIIRFADTPLLVIIEDIHWSDDTSLEFLLYLARRISTRPILLLLSYRSGDLSATLGEFLAELERRRLATDLFIPRLGRADTEAMIRSIFGLERRIQAAFLDAIYELTEGNPFFVEEILNSLVGADGSYLVDEALESNLRLELRVPRTIQVSVRRRAGHLSVVASQLLKLAAVIGRRFDYALLAKLTGYQEDALHNAVRELISAQLIIEESAEQLAYHHALTREAVYTDLLARERQALHGVVGKTMEALYGEGIDAHLPDLAYQFYEAGNWEKALVYCARAGERSSRLYALQAAIDHFTHALEAAYHLKAAVPPSLYGARSQAYQIRGEFERSHADLESAIHIAGINQDPRAEWQYLLNMGQLWLERDYLKARDYLQSALALAKRIEDPELLARTLNPIGNWYINSVQPQEAIGYHEQALVLFEQLSSKPGVAETLLLLGFTCGFIGDVWRGKALLDRAIDLFIELDDRPRLVDAYCTRGAGSLVRTMDTFVPANSTLSDAIQQLETALRIAHEIDSPNGEAWALYFLYTCIEGQGKYTQAITLAMQGLAIAEETGHRELICAYHTGLGALYLDLFALDEAQQHLELAASLAKQLGHGYFVTDAGAWLVLLHIRQGRSSLAQTVLDSVSDAATPQLTLAQRRCWYCRALLALTKGDGQTALQELDALIASAPNSDGEQVIPLLAIARGEALIALGRLGEAEATLGAAQATLARWGAPSLEWRASALLSKSLRLQGQRNQADEVDNATKALVDALATNIEDEPLRAKFLEGARRQLPAARPVSPRQAAKRSFGGLTAREREVASLVARGLTNRQIAEQLVISEETVTVHVKHVLNKLHFTSRAQIAAWIVQQDLQAFPHDNNSV